MRGIAAQTCFCIYTCEALTDDRRKLLILGEVETVRWLKADAGDLWTPVPACFKPNSKAAESVCGSFDGVPVASFEDAPGGLCFMLGGAIVGGVSFVPDVGVFASWSIDNGMKRTHDLLTPAGELQ